MTTVASPLSAPAPGVVDLFRALADPTRLRILALLQAMELSVGELAQMLGQSQPRVSRHIRILAEAGLTIRRREGSWVFLSLAPGQALAPLFTLIQNMASPVDQAWMAADRARLAAIRAERAAAAERYFTAHASQWDAIRSLHIAEAEVEARMTHVLDGPLGRLADIGTGTGRMIELFGPRASHCVGIDRSPEMLRLARARLSAAAFADDQGHWELRQGDVFALPIADASVDTAVLHQILHFLPAPEQALVEVYRILKPGGRALIADFAAHEQEDLRTRAAHARLGFDDVQISRWADQAGFEIGPVETLAGDPLTVKLWLLTKSEHRVRAATPSLGPTLAPARAIQKAA